MNNNWAIVNFITRWILGLLFLMAGYWKVFILTPAAHAQQFFVDGFADTWIPAWFLNALGYGIPVLELAAGLLICIANPGGTDRGRPTAYRHNIWPCASATAVRYRWSYIYPPGADCFFIAGTTR